VSTDRTDGTDRTDSNAVPAEESAGDETRRPIRRALVSVYDKTGL
jgi:hypothetical protein